MPWRDCSPTMKYTFAVRPSEHSNHGDPETKRGVLAPCRGDAAPSTSIERSKALSDGAHPGQHAAQQAKQSSALLAPPFAFQQTTPDPHRTQAEQLTPMLHLEQHMPTTDGMPRDAAHPEAASMQAPLPVHCMPDTACLPRPVQGDEQLRSAQVQIKPLPLTLSKETPAADAVGTLGRGCPHHASQSSQQRRVAGSPGMGSKSSSHYKSSRSSSEECRGSRCEADVAAGIVRSATCPPQLALESQRGSNSPKKTGLGRFSRQGMRSVSAILAQELQLSELSRVMGLT